MAPSPCASFSIVGLHTRHRARVREARWRLVKALINGTNGNDVRFGTGAADTFVLKKGND